ncbi:GNAT family N-acetyltransferase [Tumidithrix helvetica PCC 7403]
MAESFLKNSLFDIRLAQHKDIARVAEVLAISFYCDRKGNWTFLTNCFYPIIRWGISVDLNNRLLDITPHYACFVVTPDAEPDRIVASAEICLRHIPIGSSSFPLFNWNSDRQYPYLFNLAVHPDWRRKGAAKLLIKSVEKTAKSWGCSQVYMHALENNFAARSLYDDMGYNFHRFDPDLSQWLMGSPRRLLLRKPIN